MIISGPIEPLYWKDKTEIELMIENWLLSIDFCAAFSEKQVLRNERRLFLSVLKFEFDETFWYSMSERGRAPAPGFPPPLPPALLPEWRSHLAHNIDQSID